MKSILILFLFSVSLNLTAQSFIQDRKIWTFKDGYRNEFEWTNEQSEDKYFKDTLYEIQFFPKENNWKIYFDANKTRIATLYIFDTVKKFITTKNYNRKGQLIREFEAEYFDKKKFNPAFPRLKNVVSIKSYLNDSIIALYKGYKTSMYIEYRNFLTKTHFEKWEYFSPDVRSDFLVGEVVWTYYEDGPLKSTCIWHSELQYDNDGNEFVVAIPNCTHFSKEGCIIRDK